MKDKDRHIVGLDVGRDDWTSECVARRNDDGTLTILELNQWKRTIDLEPARDGKPVKITIRRIYRDQVFWRGIDEQ